jgi:hypothetical protein
MHTQKATTKRKCANSNAEGENYHKAQCSAIKARAEYNKTMKKNYIDMFIRVPAGVMIPQITQAA